MWRFLTLLFLAGALPYLPYCQTQIVGHGYEFQGNGKQDSIPMLKVYHLDTTLNAPILISNAKHADTSIRINKAYLNSRTWSSLTFPDRFSYTRKDLIQSNVLVDNDSDSLDMSQFNCYQLWGEDSCGNVQFTSYYIPVIDVRKEADSVYRFPIYKKPNSQSLQTLSRKRIDQDGALKNKGLELAYASSYFDVFNIQVQGSGYVQFEDGTTKLFSFGGNNNRAYTSIGRYLIEKEYISKDSMSADAIRQWFVQNPDSLHIFYMNESYVFFNPNNDDVKGAAGVPLTPFASIATDSMYIPKGAVLLGRVPVVDAQGKCIRHEYRLLFAHDSGGAIKGPGHIDLYSGVGKDAWEYSSNMHHYGQLWILLPK